MTRVGPTNSIVDVPGLRVGHSTRIGDGWLTGSTVLLTPTHEDPWLAGAVGGVDVRGGGPGTRETDLLDPRNAVERVHAVVLTGGSAYGLAVADGVMAELEPTGIGFPVGGPDGDPAHVVPIVPAAVLFDLGRGGEFRNRPDASFGVDAVRAATTAAPAQGVVGAGAGAVAGGFKGGIGSASAVLDDATTVAALVAVNAAGSAVDPRTGRLYASSIMVAEDLPDGQRLREPTTDERRHLDEVMVQRPLTRFAAGAAHGAGQATTIGVVATDATLTKAWCSKLAGIGHDGLARALNPVHTMLDGDTLFGLATGTRASPADLAALNELFTMAATVVTRAVGRAILSAVGVQTPIGRIPAYLELVPPGR